MRITLILLYLSIALSAYTIQLKDIGDVIIPDSMCNIKLADSLEAIYNNYEYERVLNSLTEQMGKAEFVNTGRPVIALYNFFNMGNFNVKLFITKIPVDNVLGVYLPEPDIIAINSVTLHELTRVNLFFTLIHELTHNVQQEEKQLTPNIPARIINEIFADLAAVACMSKLTGVSEKAFLVLRQSPTLLSKYAEGNEETARIIINAIITKQNRELCI